MTKSEFVPTLLAIDDDPEFLSFLRDAFDDQGLQFIQTSNPFAARELVQKHSPQVVLLDMVMPGRGGLDVLEDLLEFDPSLNVVLLTGQYTQEAAVEAIEKGASDFLPKPISITTVQERIRKFIQEAQQRHNATTLQEQLLESHTFHGIIGRSAAIEEVFRRISRIAPHFQTALITGPTGSGKELIARALRELSPVATGPFAIVNCAAIVESLFESELFGHVKGSFTGATSDRVGMFEAAHNGTLFLDEIEELSPAGQAKLLRVLQERRFQRVGSTVSKEVNIRVIAATNRDLRKMVEEKRFREDLYYRLAMVQVHVPSLSERMEDLELLVAHFLQLYSKRFNKKLPVLSKTAQSAILHYTWPGNVRELENVIGNAVMMADKPLITVEHLPREFTGAWAVQTPPTTESLFSAETTLKLEEVEVRYIDHILKLEDGNVAQAAARLGIPRSTLYNRLKLMKHASRGLN